MEVPRGLWRPGWKHEIELFFNVRIIIKKLSYSAVERQMLMIAGRMSSPNWWLGD